MESQESAAAGCVTALVILLFTVALAASLLAYSPRVVTSPEDWMEDSGER